MKAQTKKTQAAITPKKAIDLLLAGNQRFLNNMSLNRNYLSQVKETTKGQYPYAVVLSCIDSRIPTEIIFDQGVGDLFNARVAGNFINTDILGSIEYGCKVAGSKVVVVMGHTSCGAVKGACDNVKLGNITPMLKNIKPAIKMVKTEKGEKRDSSNSPFVNAVSLQNVKNAIQDIHDQSPVLRKMEKAGEIEIVGAMYHVESGEVTLVG